MLRGRGRGLGPVAMLLLVSTATLQLGGVEGGKPRKPPPKKTKPAFMGFTGKTPVDKMERVAKENYLIEQQRAFKLYLLAKHKLLPEDIVHFKAAENSYPPPPSHDNMVTATLIALHNPKDPDKELAAVLNSRQDEALKKKYEKEGQLCMLSECVSNEAKSRFLQNKYIPGNDNVISEFFTEPGHMYTDRIFRVDDDLRNYILSRPRSAVPDVVRKCLFPAATMWPGGDGKDRTNYLPKGMPEYKEFDLGLPDQIAYESVAADYIDPSKYTGDVAEAQEPVKNLALEVHAEVEANETKRQELEEAEAATPMLAEDAVQEARERAEERSRDSSVLQKSLNILLDTLMWVGLGGAVLMLPAAVWMWMLKRSIIATQAAKDAGDDGDLTSGKGGKMRAITINVEALKKKASAPSRLVAQLL